MIIYLGFLIYYHWRVFVGRSIAACRAKTNKGKKVIPELEQKYNFKGATILEGNRLHLYQSELPTETNKTAEQLVDEYIKNINQFKNDNKGSIRKVQEGATTLRRYSRNGREGVSTSYEQAQRDLHPTQEFVNCLHEPRNLTEWARKNLPEKVKRAVEWVSKLKSDIGTAINPNKESKTYQKLVSIGEMFAQYPLARVCNA